MRAPRRPGTGRLIAGLLAGMGLFAGAGLLAGCGSSGTSAASGWSVPAAASPLVTSMTTAGGRAWAIVAMGGPGNNSFWELFTRPAGGGQWQLVTPPGVADNGGLIAAAGGGAVTVAFRPSQGLSFSPLALTGDGGKTWGTGLIDAPVASVPDALAAGGGGTMIALLDGGAIDQAAGPGASWTRLAAPGAVAASPAGRRCQVTALTGVSYTPSGAPLAAASCARPGIAGIFARTGSAWAATGPAVPGGRPVRVLRLSGTPSGDVALLQAGTGSTASLLAAWTGDGSRWTVSPSFPAGSVPVLASGTGSGGAVWVLLANGRAEVASGPGPRPGSGSGSGSASAAVWRELPKPPRGTAALAVMPDGAFDALAASGGKLAVYRLGTAGSWTSVQAISVPVQYGTSG